MDAYKALEKKFSEIAKVDNAASILGWDSQTIMPDGGADQRNESLAYLDVLMHNMLVAPEISTLLDEAYLQSCDLLDMEMANLNYMADCHKGAACFTPEFVERASITSAECEMVWRTARTNSDFKLLLPYLEKVVEVQREKAEIKGERFGIPTYDALLDNYERGMTQSFIDPVFERLDKELPALIQAGLDKQNGAELVKISCSTSEQERLFRIVMDKMGFDFNRGRLDTTTHPFCGGYNDDIRVALRYDESDLLPGLMGAIHEAGHGIYEQGRPRGRWTGQPVGRAMGMAIHESQSLVYEMQMGRSREFATFLTQLLHDELGYNFTEEAIYRQLTHVARGFIRVDADELTYPGHVLMRYKIEKAMVSDDLAVADLPGAFNEMYESYFGIKVPNDRLGCLQDTHWPSGYFGYFPTYTLGAVLAAQLYDAAKRGGGLMNGDIAVGHFDGLKIWLGDNIHKKGCSLGMNELITGATGQGLNPDIYMAHLKRRYIDDVV